MTVSLTPGKITMYGFDLLADPSVIVTSTAGTLNGKYLDSLSDFDPVLDWQAAGAGGNRVYADQSSGTQVVDSLCVVKGHGLAGIRVDLEWSTDATTWTSVGNFTPTDDSGFAIESSTLGLVKRYWALHYASGQPKIMEISFSRRFTFELFMSEQTLQQMLTGIGSKLTSYTGKIWAVKQNDPIWRTQFVQRELTVTQREDLETLFQDISGSYLPFFVKDADGVIRFVTMTNASLSLTAVPVYKWNVQFDLVEMM